MNEFYAGRKLQRVISWNIHNLHDIAVKSLLMFELRIPVKQYTTEWDSGGGWAELSLALPHRRWKQQWKTCCSSVVRIPLSTVCEKLLTTSPRMHAFGNTDRSNVLCLIIFKIGQSTRHFGLIPHFLSRLGSGAFKSALRLLDLEVQENDEGMLAIFHSNSTIRSQHARCGRTTVKLRLSSTAMGLSGRGHGVVNREIRAHGKLVFILGTARACSSVYLHKAVDPKVRRLNTSILLADRSTSTSTIYCQLLDVNRITVLSEFHSTFAILLP